MTTSNNLSQHRYFCDINRHTDSSWCVRLYQVRSFIHTQLIHALTVMRYCLSPEQKQPQYIGHTGRHWQTVALLLKREQQHEYYLSLSVPPSSLGCDCSSLCVSSGSTHFCPTIPQHGRQLFGNMHRAVRLYLSVQSKLIHAN